VHLVLYGKRPRQARLLDLAAVSLVHTDETFAVAIPLQVPLIGESFFYVAAEFSILTLTLPLLNIQFLIGIPQLTQIFYIVFIIGLLSILQESLVAHV